MRGLGHTVTGAEKSHNRPSAGRSPRGASGVTRSKSEGLRTRDTVLFLLFWGSRPEDLGAVAVSSKVQRPENLELWCAETTLECPSSRKKRASSSAFRCFWLGGTCPRWEWVAFQPRLMWQSPLETPDSPRSIAPTSVSNLLTSQHSTVIYRLHMQVPHNPVSKKKKKSIMF